MTNVKKMLMAAAGAAGGDPVNVENVFSTFLYEGADAAKTIVNNIDLTEGGLVWGKSRSAAQDPRIYDTEGNSLYPNYPYAAGSSSGLFTANNNGFDLSASSGLVGGPVYGGPDYVSWTFRKAPKFFDIVAYTGNGTAGRTVAHNLGSVPGMMWIKNLDRSNEGWRVYHRGANGGTNPGQYYAMLQSDNLFAAASTPWNNTAPTSSVFTLGTDTGSNNNGDSFIAYLFAHNNSDGEFGPDADQDIIKCGYYTGDGGTDNNINVGFEPQWVMIKKESGSGAGGSWVLFDSMRGFTDNSTNRLVANTNGAEYEDTSYNAVAPTNTGFKLTRNENWYNGSGYKYVYMAIRRGPMAIPTSATDVFALDFARAAADNEKPEYRSGFPVDTRLSIYRNGGSSSYPTLGSRLTGIKYLVTSSTAAENNWSEQKFDYMNGFMDTAASSINTTFLSYMWRRAPNFFDVVIYDGTGSTRTVPHNLGVAPEMMWFKGRNQSAYNWMVYHENISPANGMYLSDSGAASGASFQFASTSPTATVFTVGSGADVNNSNEPYIAVLFTTLAGISKVGNYTGNGGSQVINCGFSNGARFVLIKRTDASGDWVVYDTSRGITQSTDPHIDLNNQNAETTGNKNYIYPSSSGFAIQNLASGTNNPNINVSSATYVFYAIA